MSRVQGLGFMFGRSYTECYRMFRFGLPSLSNSWIISISYLYIARNMTPSIDCYYVGAVPNFSSVF